MRLTPRNQHHRGSPGHSLKAPGVESGPLRGVGHGVQRLEKGAVTVARRRCDSAAGLSTFWGWSSRPSDAERSRRRLGGLSGLNQFGLN